jgi:hypothetical protein
MDVPSLTEAVPLTVVTPQEWFADLPDANPLRAVGRVLPFARMEIRDAEGSVLPIGAEGEINARVEAQMRRSLRWRYSASRTGGGGRRRWRCAPSARMPP